MSKVAWLRSVCSTYNTSSPDRDLAISRCWPTIDATATLSSSRPGRHQTNLVDFWVKMMVFLAGPLPEKATIAVLHFITLLNAGIKVCSSEVDV
ncbi:hypothetical protein BP6252_00536 [Coleophoma cylindrospora]|uniref:Uncharacterized protein n=1 Tax=Coleophoma cylindrospora TaxID=1849047 RepID=A0A3D8SQM8_9HELO|nr:hypothetical protein BP6252_00536 [Coleophoma cylindrospora]